MATTADQLEKLAKLFHDGIITREELEQQKRERFELERGPGAAYPFACTEDARLLVFFGRIHP